MLEYISVINEGLGSITPRLPYLRTLLPYNEDQAYSTTLQIFKHTNLYDGCRHN